MPETSERLSKLYLRAALCGFASFVIYIACLQAVFFKIDGPFLVMRLQQSDLEHPYNWLYMPLLGAVHALLSSVGASAYMSALVFSALGVALGVAFSLIAFSRLAATSAQALRATALVAFCPPVFFFATVVEHHGPFFAFAGLSFWVAVEFERRPTVFRAALLGFSMLLAYGVHSTGILLPWLLLTAFVARRIRLGLTRRDLLLACLAGGIASLALLDVMRVDAAKVLDTGIGQPRGLAYLPLVVWEEWLWPFLPISVLWWWSFRLRDLRLEAWALLVAVLPYLALCMLLIVGEPEFGAYTLPLVIPMAGLLVRCLRPVLLWMVVAGSLLISVYQVQAHDDDSAYRAWASGFLTAVGETDQVFLGGTEEISMWLAMLPEREVHLAPGLAGAFDPAQYPMLLEQFDVAASHWQSQGKTVWFTAGGRLGLADPDLPFGQVLLDHIKAKYQPEDVREAGFSAWRLKD